MADNKSQTPPNPTAKTALSSRKRWKRFGDRIGIIDGAVGLIAGLVTIPKSTKDTVDALYARPEISVHPNSEIPTTYDPKQKTLSLTWVILIKNDGEASDVIDSCTAYLGVSKDEANRLIFDDANIELKDGAAEKSVPFSVKKRDDRTITFTLTTDVTAKLLNLLSQGAGQREVVISLASKYGTYSAFHYYFCPDNTLRDNIFPPGSSSPVNSRLRK
jgi:hypothetical protein